MKTTNTQDKGRKPMKMTGKLTVVLAGALAGLLAASSASAAVVPVITQTATPGTRSDFNGSTVGNKIHIGASPITIDALGVQDLGITSAQVGVWDASATLLVSATVTSSDMLGTDSYRYVFVTPFTLQANTDYVIGALVDSGGIYDGVFSPAFSTIAGVSFVDSRYAIGGWAMPWQLAGGDPGRWAPANLLLAVPEPTTLALLSLGGLLLWRRRMRK